MKKLRLDLYNCWCVIILLWKGIVSPVLGVGKTCTLSNHKFITNQQTFNILNRIDFIPKNHTSNFLPLIHDKKSNKLIIGAKDYIIYIDDTTLKQTGSLYWESESQKKSTCLQHKGTPNDYCANHVHFLTIFKDNLFACGTNSLVPKYKVVNLRNSSIPDVEKISNGICSLRPDYPVVGEFSDLGELITGTYRDYAKYPVISGTFIFDNTQKQKTKPQGGNREFMNEPKFISTIIAGDSVYIFVMEKAVENFDKTTSTVIRICKGDNGGSRIMGEGMWTTFRKSRLICTIERNSIQYKFTNLVDVVYDKDRDLFYASYTMFKELNMYSAVCTFLRSDVDATFSGKFIETARGTNYLKPIDNGNFLIGCDVNPANLTRKPKMIIKGKQPTNYLNINALSKANYYSLMERKVLHTPSIFEYIQPGASFTKSTTTQIQGNTPLYFIGTEGGSILIVYKPKDSKPCLSKEILTNIGKVERLLFNKEKNLLYASSIKKVISLDFNKYCNSFSSESDCLTKSHNPLCGWSSVENKCIASSDSTDVKKDLTQCSISTDFFGSWSKWSNCDYSTRKYCRCRSRSCMSCDTSLCDGPLNQITNCSVNTIENMKSWEVNGPIDGKWSDWLPWSACSLGKCGNFTMTRLRTCSVPEPTNGGRTCPGDSFECKSCPRMPTVREAITIWSGWGSWGECIQVNGVNLMNSTRKCSKPNSCIGSSIKKLPCTTNGDTEWGEWSGCSCAQRVRHRLPVIINGCDKCSALTYPFYEICDCPTSTTEQVVTSPSVTTSRICTPAPSSSGPTVVGEATDVKTSTKNNDKDVLTGPTTQPTKKIEQVIQGAQKDPRCNPENQFTLKQLIVIITIVIITCFLMFGLIIYLILRKKHNEKAHLNGGTKSDRHPLNAIET